MADIWSDETRYQIWLDVEIAALEKMADLGLVPESAVADVKEKADFSVERTQEIEEEVKHDVIAFLTNVAEHVGESSRFVHRGMTSNDLLDTTLAVQFSRAGKLLTDGIDELLESIKQRAQEHRYTPTIGRSHGIHAEPTTFGLKLIGWYAELKRRKEVLLRALSAVTVGKLSGAVGTYHSLPPEVEEYVADKLHIGSETVATQVVARDRHAEFFTAIAQVGNSIERWCVEIRHLQRTEVSEAAESFQKGQKGSSAMPHKKNPILTENLTGLARLLRGYALSAMENVALWHERDISHSSVERVIAPDACLLLDFMLVRMKRVVDGLVVYPEAMRKNLDITGGLYNSGSLLIALVDAGITREKAYKLVQKHALTCWEEKRSLGDAVLADKELSSLLSKEQLEAVFDEQRHFKHVDMIFNRALQGGDA